MGKASWRLARKMAPLVLDAPAEDKQLMLAITGEHKTTVDQRPCQTKKVGKHHCNRSESLKRVVHGPIFGRKSLDAELDGGVNECIHECQGAMTSSLSHMCVFRWSASHVAGPVPSFPAWPLLSVGGLWLGCARLCGWALKEDGQVFSLSDDIDNDRGQQGSKRFW